MIFNCVAEHETEEQMIIQINDRVKHYLRRDFWIDIISNIEVFKMIYQGFGYWHYEEALVHKQMDELLRFEDSSEQHKMFRSYFKSSWNSIINHIIGLLFFLRFLKVGRISRIIEHN